MVKYNEMSDPKAKFKKYVGAESGGGRPNGKGFITELQRQRLSAAGAVNLTVSQSSVPNVARPRLAVQRITKDICMANVCSFIKKCHS